MNLETGADDQLRTLQDLMRSFGKVVVAFSGGVDSTFVLKVAVEVLGRENVLAVTADSPSVSRAAMAEAKQLAREIGAEHLIIESHELEDPCYAANPPDRCYYCKSDLFGRLKDLASQRGFDVIVSGANADDLGDWRPGLRAGEEHGVRNPCAEAGLTKADIRRLSRELGLPTHDKPAAPCLASRVAYGIGIDKEVLERVERAEGYLRRLGLREFRVRHHGDLARIEVPPDWIARLADPQGRQQITEFLHGLGYKYVTLDLDGYRSGSLNAAINRAGHESAEAPRGGRAVEPQSDATGTGGGG
jgi:uncharacterized protein